MGISDWIYGPADIYGINPGWPGGGVRSRPTLVDMDTVRELAGMMRSELDALELEPNVGQTTVEFTLMQVHGANPQPVAEADLDGLSAFNRNRLSVSAKRHDSWISAEFEPKHDPTVRVNVGGTTLGTPADEALRYRLQTKLRTEGRPIFRPFRLLPLVPFAVVLVGIMLWIWLLVIAAPPFPAVALGWMMVVGALIGAGWATRNIQRQLRAKVVGNRIRLETRAHTYARRIDERKNLKVAVITAAISIPAGLVGGVVLSVVTGLFGLSR